MNFISLEFLVFFPIVAGVYFLFPHRFRWAFLLAASYLFYIAWKPEYILLILASTAIDYLAGLQMGKTERLATRRAYLYLSIAVNLSLLFSFKYFNFCNASLKSLAAHLHINYAIPDLNILLPVGISFYTFQTLSYTIDVYRGKKKPEKHLGIFALYVAFFPQLVAGPIERSTHLLPQFRRLVYFNYERVRYGLILMLWGFFQKMVIADRLSIIVDKVYNAPTAFTGFPLLFATYCFAFQIYCDFSGYTDIARGAAKILGFDLMINFRQPYFADSIRDFWKRWHISLTSWFRDYLYIPLGGNRVIRWRWYYNLLVVFIVSGLWHGANWTFVIWGLLHGVYFLAAIWSATLRAGLVHLIRIDRVPFLHKCCNVLITFHLVCISWVFFRAASLTEALYILEHTFSTATINGLTVNFLSVAKWLPQLALTARGGAITLSAVLVLLAVHLREQRGDVIQFLAGRPVWFRWLIYVAVSLAVMNLGVENEVPFIYFQF